MDNDFQKKIDQREKQLMQKIEDKSIKIQERFMKRSNA